MIHIQDDGLPQGFTLSVILFMITIDDTDVGNLIPSS